MQVCPASASVICKKLLRSLASAGARCCKAVRASQQPFLAASSTPDTATIGRGYVTPGAEAWTACVQVRWWDITAGEQLFRLDGHTDYIRSSACSPSSPDTWATGMGQ